MAASIGRATLVAGSITVLNADVTADTNIFLSHQSAGGTLGNLYISNVIPKTQFTISSTSGSDTSVVLWNFLPPSSIALLANPPTTTPLINETSSVKNIPVLAPSIVDSGVNDTWLKWMGQVSQIVNLLVIAVNGK